MEMLVFLVSLAVSVSVGFFVVSRSPRKLVNQIYGLLTLSFIVLGTANYMTLMPSDSMLFYVRTTIVATSFTLLALYFLIIALHNPKDNKLLRSWSNRMVVILTAIVAVCDLSPLVFSGVAQGSARLIPIAEPGIVVFIAHFVILGVMSLRLLLKGVRGGSPRMRAQFTHILIGIAPTVLFAPITAVVLPTIYGDASYIFLTPLYVAFFVLMVAYAIIRHRLFDIRLAAVRSAVYIAVLTSMSIIYISLVYAISFIFSLSGEVNIAQVNPASVLIALVLGFLFQPIKRFFDHLTSRLFFRDYYSSDQFFAEMNRELSATTDLRSLLQRAATTIQETLKLEQAFMYVHYGDGHHMTGGSRSHAILRHDEIAIIDKYTNSQEAQYFARDDMDEDSVVAEILRRHRIALILPLRRGQEVISYVFLGEQRSGSYSQRDIRVLTTIADGLIIAIQNALSVQNVRELNATLQQRIDDATKELRQSNEKLQRLDAAKDEFVSMASHQLRTPLTSVKGYISMVLEGDAGKISEMQAKLLGEAFTSSERMVHLINDFLNVSRLQTGKFIIDRRSVDLAKVVEQEVESLQTTAHAHDLKLRYRKPSRFPILYLDEGKLRQVIMNFIDNAIYYSREFTTITIDLSIVEGDVVMKVIDTGMGVPAAEQKHLFTKFFRATNARKQRPDGTGVGLFLSKKVISAHCGSVVFDSVEGEGSTFGFRLPIKKLSLAPADNAE